MPSRASPLPQGLKLLTTFAGSINFCGSGLARDDLIQGADQSQIASHSEAGNVLGAVGISGDLSDVDEQCAITAIEGLGLQADAGVAA